MNTRISVLMTTFRAGGLDLFLGSLAGQTFQEPWEIVLVDELHGEREEVVRTYAEDLGLDGRLKHLPAPAPREGTVINYSRSLNEGLVHCDGECVLFEMDFTALEPTVLERLWRLHKTFPNGVVSGLAHPVKKHPEIVDERGPISLFHQPLEAIDPEQDAERFEILQDDRFRPQMGIMSVTMLALMDDLTLYEYGYTVSPNYLVPLESLLNINGYDEAYDEGGHGFDDLDIMSRLKHGAGAEFLVDTQRGSNAYIMEHPWSRLPEEKPNPNRERHIQRAQAINLGIETPWIDNDRVLWAARQARFFQEVEQGRVAQASIIRSSLQALMEHGIALRERNATQLARLGWVWKEAEGSVLEVGAREGQYPDREGWIRLDIEGGPGPHVVGDGEALPFMDGSFDTVLLAEVLEHVEEPRRLLREALRVARGRVVLTTPNEWHWNESFDPFSQSFKQHRRYYTYSSLLEELEAVQDEGARTFSILPLEWRGLSFFLAEIWKEGLFRR